MYLMYETEIMNNQGTGFSLQADTPQDVLNQLEGESFTVKYYSLHTPTGILEIRTKQDLIQWFLNVVEDEN